MTSRKNLLTGIALGAVAVVAIAFALGNPHATNLAGQPLSGELQQTAAAAETYSFQPSVETLAATAPAAGEEESTAAPTTINAEQALAVRSEGNPDAPVKMEEFASLTCSHCGDFYRNTFPKIQAEYIDTGKVYFTYTDFPLNGPALDAAMAARCIPESRYFSFIKLLFDKQADWAYSENYRTLLQNDSALLGLGSEAFAACLNNEDLRKGIAERMQAASTEHGVESTPTFVINGEKIAGARPFEDFKKVIDKYLDDAGKDNKAPEEN
jgi:protein-disulfide isomerase